MNVDAAVLFIPLVAALVVTAIVYLLTLQKAFQRCSPQCRTLSPGLVWLLLIPLFNFGWCFVVVTSLSRSLHNEFVRRNLTHFEPEPGKGIGIAAYILNICAIIPIIGILPAIAGIICWIIYWVKIAEFSRAIEMPLAEAAVPRAGLANLRCRNCGNINPAGRAHCVACGGTALEIAL